MTKRKEAIETIFKKMRPSITKRGAFWDGEVRSLYTNQGGLYAARQIAEKMSFREYQIVTPQCNVMHYLFAKDRATAEKELLSCIKTVIAWGHEDTAEEDDDA